MLNENQINTIKNILSGYPVLKAWVFGSYARNEETPDSDIDILVKLDYAQKIGIDFYDMWDKLEEATGKSIDFIPKECLKDHARESSKKDRILIYERTGQKKELI